MLGAEPPMNCWKCGNTIDSQDRIGFHAHCAQCDRPLHVCRNCSFYDSAYNNQCRETMAERVVDKERENFCDYFAPVTGSSGAAAAKSPQVNARERLEALFKKKP